ncbi:TetR/AcrR family transcriptional regulator [Blastococcus saxobsidens]|uniref:TetR/AcrR family transcriptional regulator n=1 Tax=Blastococcus saxobsidens TaxID=138336 RepID=A0A6L9W0G3_9ACTN|nr:TetR/AcrR family transcriptional regulator [Blastococcus saxobsidens]
MPRAGLTPERVAREAADVADELGFDRLTLAAVAQRLGVRLPSLYKHIDSLDGLRRDVAVLGTVQLTQAITDAAVGRSGEAALHALATAYRDFARGHPGRYAASVRAPDPGDAEHVKAADAALRIVLAVLAGYGLTGEDAIDATRSLRAALHGFVTLEAAGGFGMPRDVDRSFDRFLTSFDTTVRNWSGRTR